MRPAAFGAAPATLAGSLSTAAEDGGHDPQGLRPHPLSGRGSPPGDFISHARKAGDSNATGLAAQSLAATPGALAGSPSVPFPGFEPGRHSPEECGSASWPRRALRVTDRIRTGAVTSARSRAKPLTLRSRGACPEDRTPTTALPRRRADRYHQTGTSWGSAIRTRISRFQRPAGCRLPYSPSGAACRSRTCRLEGTSFALWPAELTRHKYARRESNPHQPGPRPGPSTKVRHERLEPLDRLERSPPGYDAGTLPGATEAWAPGAGVEPTSPGSGPGILPLNDPGSSAEGAIRTHRPRGLSSRGLAGCRHSRMVRREGLEPPRPSD